MEVKFVKYDKNFLNKSWNWLNDKEIQKLTMTPIFSREEQIVWYKSLNERKNYFIWGILCDGNPIGACGIKNIKNSEGEYWGYIGEKSYWGKGIGKIMLQMVIDIAIQLKLKRIYLKVLAENKRAINLYKKFNFIKISVSNNIIIMSRDLV